MKISAVLFALGCAIIAESGTAESWYWNGSTTMSDAGKAASYGMSVLASTNWVNATTGANGIPAAGDIAIFDSAYPNSGRTIGIDIGNITFGGFLYTNKNCNVNQGTVTVQAGGMGVKILTKQSTAYSDDNPYWNSEVSIKGSGEFPIDVKYSTASLKIQKNFTAASGVTVVKTGAGLLYVFCQGGTARTYDVPKTLLKGGTFRIDAYETKVSKGSEFWFDSNDSVLRLYLGFYSTNTEIERHNWVIKDGGLYESAAVSNHLHEIYSATTNLLVFTGAPKANPLIFTGRLTGNAGLKWTPSVDSEFVFSGGVSPSTGKLIVTNGTVSVQDGAQFAALEQVAISCDGKLNVAAGSCVCTSRLTRNGEDVAPGFYSGVANSLVQTLDCLTGEGVVRVGPPPEGTESATWTKAGEGNVSDAANWEGEVTPELGGATTTVVIAESVSSNAVTMTLDRDVWLKGVDAQHDDWLTFSGTKELGLGSDGLKVANHRRIVVDAPTRLTANQEWLIRDNGGLQVLKPVSSFPDSTLLVDGTGWIEWNAACPQLWGPVILSNLTVRLGANTTCGSVGSQPLFIYHRTASASPTYSSGLVVNRDLWICDSVSEKSYRISMIEVPANGTLTFNGTVASTNTTTLGLTLNKGGVITFNKLFMSRNAGSISGDGTAIFNGPYHCRDRFSMAGNCTVELHATLNRFNGNMGNWSSGTVKTMVPYAFEAANNTRRQPNDTTNNSGDSSQRTWLNPHNCAVLDLCGNDQSVDHIALHGGGGTIKSDTAATLHVIRMDGYWAWHNVSYGYTLPSGYPKTDQYGYECVDAGYWKGGVSLSFEATKPAQRFMTRASTSTGCVQVVSGHLIFMRKAQTSGETFDLKLGSENPYPRATTDGSWQNASAAIVKGGVLELEHSKVFGRKTTVEISGEGKLQLDEGVKQHVASLTVDGEPVADGIYGSAESGAPQTLTCLTGPGILRVGHVGTILILR